MEYEYFQAFARAAWTGDATQLPAWWVQLYRHAGASHVLAVSGQHVHALTFVFLWGLRAVIRVLMWVSPCLGERVGDGVVDKLPLFACGVLLLLSDFSPSVLRAFVMVASFWILRRRSLFASSLQKMASSLAMVVLIFPTRAEEIGFLLSGAMTGWLLLLREGNWKETLREYVWLSVSLSLLAMPLTVYFFGGFSYLSPLWNLFLAPIWDGVLIPVIYAMSLLAELTLFAPFVAYFDYCLRFFVEFHSLLEPWVDASYISMPRPNPLELLCVEVWVFCVVSYLRNNAPSIDFS